MDHVVTAGECITSIAEAHGLFWHTVWEHPRNAALRARRGDPNVLMAGDVVFVPALRVTPVAIATGMRHRYRRRGIPAKLNLTLRVDGLPLADRAWVLTIDGGGRVEGRTDADGKLSAAIPPLARSATLVVGEGATRMTYAVALGQIDPVDELSGVQGRLTNLGFPCGAIDGVSSPATRRALRAFQAAVGLEPTGEADAETRRELVRRHDEHAA